LTVVVSLGAAKPAMTIRRCPALHALRAGATAAQGGQGADDSTGEQKAAEK